MKTNLYLFLFLFIISACTSNEYNLQYDRKNLVFVEKDSLPDMEIRNEVYVPAYSDIYYETENKKTYLTVILSLRNISFTDTIFFERIDYYSSNGKLLKTYNDKVLVLRPMESMEYIVREADKEGGAGANFVVTYQANASLRNPPFIESIMMGNLDNYRFAFSSKGIPIQK
jgi:hypothetical protein